MNPDQFSAPSGRLLRSGPGVAAYWAFVPNPLPPAVDHDAGLIFVLADASYALGELAALGRMLPNPHLLINPFIRREAVLSSRIEGTRADVADVYTYEAGQLGKPGLAPSPPEADVREVANYVTALEYGIARLQTLPVSLRLIRELHERLMRGVRGEQMTPGEFRRSQNWIGRSGSTLNEATYVPPPVPEMHDALDALEKYIHSDDHEEAPLVRLALIHYQFEAIHPFLDGNGRIGRLLLSLLLVEWKLLPLPLLYLSAYFERTRARYYELLLAVSQRGAWREWLRYVLAGVAEQSRDATNRLTLLQDTQATWRERLLHERSPALPIRLMDRLFVRPIISVGQAQVYLEVTRRSAALAVEKLVEAGVLQQLGEASYGRVYVAGEILRIVGEGDIGRPLDEPETDRYF